MKRAVAVLALIALLSGCIADPVERPGLSARPVTLQVPESPQYAGLVVQGTLSATSGALHVDAWARNDGNRTYRVETGCSSAWSQELLDASTRERVPLREPRAQCEAFALADFAPGDERTYRVSWDGTVWDEAAQEQVAAAPGDYVWSVRFVAYNPAAQDAQLKRFDLDFDVTVLAT